ncbi:MAG TPA: cupin domain-containing protein [Polyangiaceae bacterium]|nr:cupin domain-containing protein [Polyangiaceae bacterium]
MSNLRRRDLLSFGIPATVALSPMAEAAAREPRTTSLKDTGQFPNSRLPALVYEAALPPGADLADRFEALFEKNGWSRSWRNGLYRVHHYHSTAHEVLGVYRGFVKVRLGGPDGPTVELHAGDVAIIPAGVAHKNEAQSDDFAVVGAYPAGTGPDMQYGKEGERPRTDRNIAAVALPPRDPVAGQTGALPRLWR